MKKSPLYNYIKNQYLLGKFSNDEMITLVSLGRITDAERLEIIELKDV